MKTSILFMMLAGIGTSLFCQYDVDKNKEKINNYLRTNTSRFLGDTLSTFAGKGTDGRYYSNDSLKGKITFISLWFSACIPCINELDELKKLYEKYKNNQTFQFISFTFDPIDVTKKTIRNYSLPYSVINLTDAECIVLNFGKGYPLNMITDKSARIVNMTTGREIFGEVNYFKNKIYPILDSLLLSK
jgi:cytochrome oxidase Cu insertion factor (SCO1/SenC/PrrC family)